VTESSAGPAQGAGERLIRWIETFGWRGRVVPIARLRDLREAIVGRHARGEFDEAVYHEQLGAFAFEAPAELPDAHAILVLAVPTPSMRVTFRWRGARVPAILPPTYVSYSRRTENVQEVVSCWLERAGFRTAKPRLPLKTLAVGSGLAEYGRNNLCYVSGMGSHLQLVGLFSDLPCPDDPWREPRMLERCARCDTCRERCPTGAIAADRVLLHTERCLTLHNESPEDFPEWIQPSWHGCLVGCLRCQDRCPENGRVGRWVEDRAEFSEGETAVLLGLDAPDSPPASLPAKLEGLGLSYDLRLLGRNLAALMAAREAAARDGGDGP
jgi:epoxyqueuosine reductase